MSVYTNNKVEPGLQRELWVFIAENLEAECVVPRSTPGLGRGLSIQPADESIESAKHGLNDLYSCCRRTRVERGPEEGKWTELVACRVNSANILIDRI